MMNEFIITAQKDFKEILRGRKNVYFALTLLAIGAMIILTTLFSPNLISALGDKAPDMISDSKSLDDLMKNLFPNNVLGSVGIWASDVGVFYTIVVTLVTHGIISEELKNGRWIMPVAVGYDRRVLLASKCIVYGASAAFPVLVLTNLYYMMASTILEGGENISFPIFQSLSLSIAIGGITIITILLSVLYSHSISAAVSMIIIVLVAPDVLTYFKFGRYLPTYLLTFSYTMSTNALELLIPFAELVILCIILFIFASNKIVKTEIQR